MGESAVFNKSPFQGDITRAGTVFSSTGIRIACFVFILTTNSVVRKLNSDRGINHCIAFCIIVELFVKLEHILYLCLLIVL